MKGPKGSWCFYAFFRVTTSLRSQQQVGFVNKVVELSQPQLTHEGAEEKPSFRNFSLPNRRKPKSDPLLSVLQQRHRIRLDNAKNTGVLSVYSSSPSRLSQRLCHSTAASSHNPHFTRENTGEPLILHKWAYSRGAQPTNWGGPKVVLGSPAHRSLMYYSKAIEITTRTSQQQTGKNWINQKLTSNKSKIWDIL